MKLFFNEQQFNPENDKNLQYSLGLIYIFAGAIHIIFLIAFYKLGIHEMQVLNYFSPFLYLVAFYSNRKGNFVLSATLGVIEALGHGVISLFYISWEANFYVYIIFVYFLLFFIYKINNFTRILVSVVITALFAYAYYYAITQGPQYQVPDFYLFILGVGNIVLLAVLLSVFGISYSHFVLQNFKFLRYAEKQQRMLNAQKNKFFSIFSHDLKNPVIALDNFVNIMLQKYDTIDSEQKKNYLGQIQNSVSDLRRLVNGLFEWSTSQMDNINIFPRKIELKPALEETKSLVDHHAVQKRIQIIIHTVDNISVFADEQMFRSILRNLVSNAVKFTKSDGLVEIFTEQLNEHVAITVRDNGIGIPEENINNLFRLDKKNIRTGTNNESGTGLGLIVAKEFIEKNKGSIRIESVENTGTSVTISLPAGDQVQ